MTDYFPPGYFPSGALTAADELKALLEAPEGEHFEFKEAKTQYDTEKLARYCCALANAGGGKVVLGVTDKRPRVVVGTQAFQQLEQIRRFLMNRVPLRIQVRELQSPQGRVLVFDIPARPVGQPIKCEGVYWSRDADSLVPMSEHELRSIFAEAGHDYSADVCPGARLEHLDEQAIEEFRRRWIEKSGNQALAGRCREQLLRDAELLVGGGVTNAALILLGTRAALGRFMGQAEVVFEYRSSEATGPAQQRKEYRQGFFSFYDDLWQTIALRNDIQHYQDGLFVLDIPTFAERSVREALLNAVSHREYQLGGNVFVRQYARRLVVESPGGFPVGITLENLLDRQSPRNRRIADTFARCGLVERSGQGMNRMFEESISHGKQRPDFTGTDAYNVVLTLHGEVGDPRFIQFLEKVGQETQTSFSTHDFVLLDLIHRDEPIPVELRPRIQQLVDRGVLERIGSGRGTRYLLSSRFYSSLGQRATYTRRRGLDREENKAILLKHLRQCGKAGCAISELQMVLPGSSRDRLKRLLDELRREGKARLEGERRGAKWILVGE